MNPMLEPRMVAARTQIPRPGSTWAQSAVRIAASSHGGLPMMAILYSFADCKMPLILSAIGIIAKTAQLRQLAQKTKI
jgi:hypothetical protein